MRCEDVDYSKEPSGVYLMIDNKSFYATVECTTRNLDPLTTPLVVMSEADNTGSGLILASSPAAKKLFDLHNVNRARDLPADDRLLVVPPRMNLYIKKNLEVNAIYQQFIPPEDILPYSIDESLLNLTHSWQLTSSNIYDVITAIQATVHDRLHLVTTIGVGNNPLQAKIALDVYSKHNKEGIGVITNNIATQKIWEIDNLTDVWGINHRMANRLNNIGITNMYELAHTDPHLLKRELGQIGVRLYATAWGIDRTVLSHQPLKRDRSIGNSQVLPRDYVKKGEIELVIKEITAQVASRLRARHKQANGVYLGIGYAKGVIDEDGRTGFAHSKKLDVSTADERKLILPILDLFEQHWQGQPVRHISVSASRLSERFGEQLNLFQSRAATVAIDVENTMDEIRQKFGKTAIMKASSLEKGGTFISRSKLVGGHGGGQSFE